MVIDRAVLYLISPVGTPLNMFHPARRRGEPTAYEYNLQATEDHDEDNDHVHPVPEKRRVPIGKRPNYKPTALTWPFIVAYILLLVIAMGLIVWAVKTMPDSDSTAIIDPIPSQAFPGRVVRAEFGKLFQRDNTSSVVETTSTRLDVQVTTSQASDGGSSAAISETTVATDLSDYTRTTDLSITAVTSGVASADTTRSGFEGSTTAQETASSIVLSSSVSSPTSASSTDAFSSSSESLGPVTSMKESSTSESSTTSTEGASSDSRVSTSSTSKADTSVVTDTSSVTGSQQSASSTHTPSSSSSGSASGTGSRNNKNGQISTFVDPTATGNTTSFITSVFTSGFTTTAKSTMNLTRTLTIPEHTTTFNVTRSTVYTSFRTRTTKSTRPSTTAPYSYTVTETYSSTSVYSSTGFESVEPSTSVFVSEVTSVVESFTVIAPTTVATEVVEPTTIISATVVLTTSEVPDTTSQTVVQTYVPYLSTGQTVITSVATVIIQPPQTQAKTEVPVVVVGTSVAGGQVYTVVETFAPQTKVVGDNLVPATQVSTPPPQTIVSQVGGTVITNFIVVTPTPTTQTATFGVQSTIGGDSQTFVQTQAPQTIVTSQDGSLVTLITTPPPQTQVTVLGGTLTTVPVTSTSSGFQPISYVITTNIGGSTSVIVATQGPTRVVTTINGTPVTFDTTLPPTTYTTTFGGTQVTETTATTPTASDPITLTFASTISGTLTTIIQTFPPTTYVTSISGHLSTVVTTPSPSTHLSTAPLSSTTFTSTSSAPSTTTSSPPAQTSLVITTKTFNLSSREYFTGTFLPPLLAVSLVIPLRIIDLNAKLYQPFNSLAHPGGATGYDALTLQFTGLMGFVTPAITLLQGHPVPFITTLTVLCASFMVPLAVEAVSLKLHGHCSALSSQGCAAALGVSPTSAHALLGLAAAIVLLLCVLLLLLRGWVTGLRANPWNIAGIASLARNPDVRVRGATDAAVRRAVADRTYGLGYYETPDGREEYGLLLADDSGRGLSRSGSDSAGADTEGEEGAAFLYTRDPVSGRRRAAGPGALPFMTLRYPWRVAFVGYLVGLLVLIAYYDYTLVAQVRDPTVPHYTRFHLFLDSHSFGIRFLFAGLGVVITFCWQAFFVGMFFPSPLDTYAYLANTLPAVATIVPFHAMAHRHQPPSRSILVSRPTNAFYGIYLALRQHHAFYVCTSLMAILSEFLPILLSNIPHKPTQVLSPTLVCTRLSMAVLAAMTAVVGWSFFVAWPPMPVDPRSVAGMVWYVCESSRMLDDFRGLAELQGRERDERVQKLGRRYYYGGLVGRGEARIGVDVEPGVGEGVSTAYRGREWGGEGVGLDPAPNEGREPRPVNTGTGGYGVRRGEDVVRAVLGRRDEWENEDLAPNRRG